MLPRCPCAARAAHRPPRTADSFADPPLRAAPCAARDRGRGRRSARARTPSSARAVSASRAPCTPRIPLRSPCRSCARASDTAPRPPRRCLRPARDEFLFVEEPHRALVFAHQARFERRASQPAHDVAKMRQPRVSVFVARPSDSDSSAANAISRARASSGNLFFDSTNAFALNAGSIGGSVVTRVDWSA